jgi:hypothetical protein
MTYKVEKRPEGTEFENSYPWVVYPIDSTTDYYGAWNKTLHFFLMDDRCSAGKKYNATVVKVIIVQELIDL